MFKIATPEALGVSSKTLLDLFRKLDSRNYMHGCVILRHGAKIAEGYWSPCRADVKNDLFSLSKSFTSSAIGIAQGEGLLSIDDKVASFFPERMSGKVSERMRRMTLRDMLTMRTGHEQCQFRRGADDDPDDWVRGFLESNVEFEPGTRFTYNTAAAYMMAAVIRKVSGEPLVDYLWPRLLEPLGFTKSSWDRCPMGIEQGGTGFHATAEEVAAFTQLYLQGGAWNGRQLIPVDYVRMATSRQSDNSGNSDDEGSDWNKGYGFQFWMCRHGCFRGDGFAGQYALAIPQADMAIAIVSGVQNMQVVLDDIFDALVATPAPPGESPLPENPAALAELREFTSSLAVRFPAGARPRASIAGRYDVAPSNPFHARSIIIEQFDDRCEVAFDIAPGAAPDPSDPVFAEPQGGLLKFVAGYDKPMASMAKYMYEYESEMLSKAVQPEGRPNAVRIATMCAASPSYAHITITKNADGTIDVRHKCDIWFRNRRIQDFTMRGVPVA